MCDEDIIEEDVVVESQTQESEDEFTPPPPVGPPPVQKPDGFTEPPACPFKPKRHTSVTVTNWGKWNDLSSAFKTDNGKYYLFADFQTKREYWSFTEKDKKTEYTSTVKKFGDTLQFEVVAADCPERVFTGPTSTTPWTLIKQAIVDLNKTEVTGKVAASGPGQFGYAQHAVLEGSVFDVLSKLGRALESNGSHIQTLKTGSQRQVERTPGLKKRSRDHFNGAKSAAVASASYSDVSDFDSEEEREEREEVRVLLRQAWKTARNGPGKISMTQLRLAVSDKARLLTNVQGPSWEVVRAFVYERKQHELAKKKK